MTLLLDHPSPFLASYGKPLKINTNILYGLAPRDCYTKIRKGFGRNHPPPPFSWNEETFVPTPLINHSDIIIRAASWPRFIHLRVNTRALGLRRLGEH